MKKIHSDLYMIVRIDTTHGDVSRTLDQLLRATRELSLPLSWNIPLCYLTNNKSPLISDFRNKLLEATSKQQAEFIPMGVTGCDHTKLFREEISLDLSLNTTTQAVTPLNFSGIMPYQLDFSREFTKELYTTSEDVFYSISQQKTNSQESLIYKIKDNSLYCGPIFHWDYSDKPGWKAFLKKTKRKKNEPSGIVFTIDSSSSITNILDFIKDITSVNFVTNNFQFKTIGQVALPVSTSPPLLWGGLPLPERITAELNVEVKRPHTQLVSDSDDFKSFSLPNREKNDLFIKTLPNKNLFFDMPGSTSLDSEKTTIFFESGRLSSFSLKQGIKTGKPVQSFICSEEDKILHKYTTVSSSTISGDNYWGLREYLICENKHTLDSGHLLADYLMTEGSDVLLISVSIQYPSLSLPSKRAIHAPYEIPLFGLSASEEILIETTYPDKDTVSGKVKPSDIQGISYGNSFCFSLKDFHFNLWFPRETNRIEAIPYRFKKNGSQYIFCLNPIGNYIPADFSRWEGIRDRISMAIYFTDKKEEKRPKLPENLLNEAVKRQINQP